MFASTMQFELQERTALLGMAGTPRPPDHFASQLRSPKPPTSMTHFFRRVAPSGDMINHEKNIKHQQETMF